MSPSWPDFDQDFMDEDVIMQDDKWYLLKIDKLGGYQRQKVVMGHLCKQFTSPQFLDEQDGLEGRCWWCGSYVPDSIKTVWTFQNWDVLGKFHRYTEHSQKGNPFNTAIMTYAIPQYRYIELLKEIDVSVMMRYYGVKLRSWIWGPVGHLFDD
jgi:hypothetical protein